MHLLRLSHETSSRHVPHRTMRVPVIALYSPPPQLPHSTTSATPHLHFLRLPRGYSERHPRSKRSRREWSGAAAVLIEMLDGWMWLESAVVADKRHGSEEHRDLEEMGDEGGLG